MDWLELKKKMALDPAYSERTRNLMALDRVLEGTQYDHIAVDFFTEETSGKPVKIRDRRPAVRTNLCAKVVSDAVSMLFAEKRFPRVQAETTEASQRFAEIVAAAQMPAAMIDAAIKGSIGSVAVLVQFAAGKIFLRPMKSIYLAPEWSPDDPSQLVRVRERYITTGAALRAAGFRSAQVGQKYWWTRDWTTSEEITYYPQTLQDASEGAAPRPRTRIEHRLGVVPVVWIKNLPNGKDPDGKSTFEAGIDDVIQLDYVESQATRSTTYMGDPMLVVKGAADDEAPIRKGPNTVLDVGPEGDAKILEVDGGSGEQFKMQSERLRRAALEAMNGNMANPDRISAATSGRMMELLHQPIIWMADRMRSSYGPAIIEILRIIGIGARIYDLQAAGKPVAPFDVDKLTLMWGAWFDPTFGEIVSFTSGLTNATEGGILSKETATHVAAPVFGILNVAKERARIDAEKQAEAKLLAAENAAVQAKTNEAE